MKKELHDYRPEEEDEIEVVVRVMYSREPQPRKKKFVVEILPDGTTAVGKEIAERTFGNGK